MDAQENGKIVDPTFFVGYARQTQRDGILRAAVGCAMKVDFAFVFERSSPYGSTTEETLADF